MMQIMQSRNIENYYLKILCYGTSGAGKTSLLKTLPPTLRTLVVSAENGLLSVKDKEFDFIVWQTKGFLNQAAELYTFLLKDKTYDLVFFDSLTEIFSNYVVELKDKYTDPKHTMKIWGDMLDDGEKFIKSFRDIPKHIVMTCLDKYEIIEETKEKYITFNLQGSIQTKIASYFDEVFYMYSDKKGERFLLTNTKDRLIAKDRSGKLEVVEPANLEIIFKKILGEKIKENKLL